MKKLLLLSVVASMFFFSCKDEGETPGGGTDGSGDTFMASLEIEKKAAVLEDFTGVRCGYCPDGHRRAADLIADYGDKMIVIGVNAGGYANPAAGWANFTTPFGQALINQSDVAGYPAGTVNRRQFTASQKGGLAMSRGDWRAASEEIMGEDAQVNMAGKAVFNSATREMTITVDMYYSYEVGTENNLNIALLQSGMTAAQAGGGADYRHKHVLRDFITGQWGEIIPASETAKGSKVTRTFTYSVPADFNGAVIPPGGGECIIDDCELVAFIANGKTDIMNGVKIEIEKE